MVGQTSKVINALSQHQKEDEQKEACGPLLGLIQPQQYVGEVYSISYESANVQIHDFHREKVGGIPSLAFLVATRLNVLAKDAAKGDTLYIQDFDYQREESSVILLRVMDSAPLPGDIEAERVRVELARKVSGESINWDGSETMDAATHNLLSFAGVQCRVIGTFYIDKTTGSKFVLRFGCDLSNYYPNRGLKVYKPNGAALKEIVNYLDPDRLDPRLNNSRVLIGQVRYASTNRTHQGVSEVPVSIAPGDLLGQKTALFGMTRTGKSNTTKIIIQSVCKLRDEQTPLRIGQLVFDPNGEYANENVQDNPNKPDAIKNVWKTSKQSNAKEDVVTYGLSKPLHDPERKLMKLNFYSEPNLQLGKDIIGTALTDISSGFITNFKLVSFNKPDTKDWGAKIRYNRHVLVYRVLLYSAGFDAPKNLKPDISGLFSKDLCAAMQGCSEPEFKAASQILGNKTPDWGQLATALQSLERFMHTKPYQAFETSYVSKKEKKKEKDSPSPTDSRSFSDMTSKDDEMLSGQDNVSDVEQDNGEGETWADTPLKSLLKMFSEQNGTRYVARAKAQHTTSIEDDYAEEIYKDLCSGKLVLVDQSTGDPEQNRIASERIMWQIFRGHQSKFREGDINIPEILIYVEEAHNLLPVGSEQQLDNVWVRTAKEGAKYHIGMVYATQEVSSIQRNILKNTANWFIGHLNNTDETKELCKYYDFADFEPSIRRAQDRGFLRVKTMSNLFVVPVQVDKFEIKEQA